MLQVKYYSNKSNAKRALAKIGAEVLAKADEVLTQSEDGQWGFDTGAAVQLQKKLTQPVVKVVQPAKVVAKPKPVVYNPAEQICPLCGKDATGNLTWHNEGVSMMCHVCSGVFSVKTGRKVTIGGKRENPNSGYTIQKQRPTQNGITRPSEGTRTEGAWKMFDELYAKGQLNSEMIRKVSQERGMNKNMVCANYVVWRKFNGLFTSK